MTKLTTQLERFKPCPFCHGNKAELQHDTNPWDSGRWYVICRVGQCRARSGTAKTKSVAVQKWNKRKEEPPEKNLTGSARLKALEIKLENLLKLVRS